MPKNAPRPSQDSLADRITDKEALGLAAIALAIVGFVTVPVVTIVVLVLAFAATWAFFYLRARQDLRLREEGLAAYREPSTVLHQLRERAQVGPYFGRKLAEPGDRSPTFERLVANHETTGIIFGPPGSGKTAAHVIPTAISHPGTTVVVSTKDDILRAAGPVNSGTDRQVYVLNFDPNLTQLPAWSRPVIWNAIAPCADWNIATTFAREMLTAGRATQGDTDGSDDDAFTASAKDLLAGLLHVAAIRGYGIEDVLDWVSGQSVDPLLGQLEPRTSPYRALAGATSWSDRFASTVWARVRQGIAPLDTDVVLDAHGGRYRDTFDPQAFATSGDVLYVICPQDAGRNFGMVVVLLLEAIKRAAYDHAARTGRALDPPMLWLLDEAGNTAPITTLPSILTEGRSRGLLVWAYFQTSSQVISGWGEHGARKILESAALVGLFPGVRDRELGEYLRDMIGKYDREIYSASTERGTSSSLAPGAWVATHGSSESYGASVTTTREWRLDLDELRSIPENQVLWLPRVGREFFVFMPTWFNDDPVRDIVQTTPPRALPAFTPERIVRDVLPLEGTAKSQSETDDWS